MAQLECVATCYMPTGRKGVLERYEDETNDKPTIVEVPDAEVELFIATGNFKYSPG